MNRNTYTKSNLDMTDKESQSQKPANQPAKADQVTPALPAYPSYWVNRKESIAVVRINDIRIQGWKPYGRDLTQDFEHSHFQTTYPSRERLDEYLKDFAPSDVDEFVDYQVKHHRWTRDR